MGANKSKSSTSTSAKKPQQSFPNQSGFSSPPSQFPQQSQFQSSQVPSGFGSQTGFSSRTPNAYSSQSSQFSPQQSRQAQLQGLPQQTNFSTNAFPPFPALSQQQLANFQNMFSQGQLMPSSGFPVAFPNQRKNLSFISNLRVKYFSKKIYFKAMRPLVQGYAPAPSSDRRANIQAHDQDQNDFSPRYQHERQSSNMVQMPQMSQMHSVRSRRH